MAKKTNRECLKSSERTWKDQSEAQLSEVAQEIALELQANFGSVGGWLRLEGPMGAGKSTFARSLLKILAPEQSSRGSPTFPLVHAYSGRVQGRPISIYHIDLYRLETVDELEDSGIWNQLDEPGAWALLEWGSKFESSWEGYRHKPILTLNIEAGSDSERRTLTLLKSDR